MNNKGYLYGIGAYVLWGILPIYWKLLGDVPSFQILLHRMVWSMVFLAVILTFQGNWSWFRETVRSGRTLLVFLAATILLSINWGVYIWAVNAGYIVESSLGYFINPLVSVFLGMVFLRERMRPWQWVAIGVAAAGVVYLTISYGQLPYIALTLAFSFGLYGLLKKQASLNSLRGLTLETMIMFVPALGILLFYEFQGTGSFGHVGVWENLLLIGTGIATSVPLLLFGAAAQRIPLSMLGFLQYFAPTLQFLIGIFIYNESFTAERLIGFSFIWAALVIFSVESFRNRQKELRLAKGLA